MTKKIAIVVRDRKHEALRMSVGATLSDDKVNVFVIDDKLEYDDEINVNLQMLSELKVKVFSNNPDNQFDQKSIEEIAGMLADFDIILPY